jgi:hypothetical protein
MNPQVLSGPRLRATRHLLLTFAGMFMSDDTIRVLISTIGSVAIALFGFLGVSARNVS